MRNMWSDHHSSSALWGIQNTKKINRSGYNWGCGGGYENTERIQFR